MDQHVRLVDRPLCAPHDLGWSEAAFCSQGDRPIDLAYAQPRAVMRDQAPLARGRRGETIGEVTAGDRERADELPGLRARGHAHDQLGEWRCGRDDGAERGMVIERVDRAARGHAYGHIQLSHQIVGQRAGGVSARCPSELAAARTRRPHPVPDRSSPHAGSARYSASMQAEATQADVIAAPPRRRWLHGLAVCIGVVALVLLVRTTGWDVLSAALARIGAWFAVIAMIDVCAILCDAGALHTFANAHHRISYPRVFAAQASGVAINRLTPGNALGEPIKVTMLLGELPRSAAVSSVVMFNVATSWVAIATIVIGAPIALLSLDLPLRAEIAVGIASVVLIGFAITVAVIIRRGAFGLVIRGLRRLRLISEARAARWQTAVVAVDADIREIGRSPRAILFVIGSRLFYSAGTVMLMYAVGLPLTSSLVLAQISVGLLINWISNIIPLGIGIADGSNYALYGALGATGPVGVVFTMVNRARVCLLALIGLSVMGISAVVFDDARRR